MVARRPTGLDVDGDIVAEIGELGPGSDGGKMQIIHVQHPDSPLSAVCADGSTLKGVQLGGELTLTLLEIGFPCLAVVGKRFGFERGLHGRGGALYGSALISGGS